MFKKPKPTFLSQAGRDGAPSVFKPFAKKNTKTSAGKHAAGNGKNTVKVQKKVVKNGAPLRAVKTKSTLSGKKASSSIKLGKASIDKRLSNYFMSHSPKLRSVTGSPQSAPQAFKPRG